jgi:hypothetical protein
MEVDRMRVPQAEMSTAGVIIALSRPRASGEFTWAVLPVGADAFGWYA